MIDTLKTKVAAEIGAGSGAVTAVIINWNHIAERAIETAILSAVGAIVGTIVGWIVVKLLPKKENNG